MANEMIERVAAAIYEACARGDRLVAVNTEDCPDIARIAIAAMREPTETMVAAGGAELSNFACDVNPDDPAGMHVVWDYRPTAAVVVDPTTYDPGEPADAADEMNARCAFISMIDTALHD